MTADLNVLVPGLPNFANPTGGGGGGSNTVDTQDDGVPVNTANTLNFTGSGVTVTDAGGGVADVAIAGGGSTIPTTKLIGVADSPYTQLTSDEYLVVDATGADVVINLLAVASATKVLQIKVIGLGVGRTVTINPNGVETIDADASLVLSTVQQMVRLVPYTAGSRWLLS